MPTIDIGLIPGAARNASSMWPLQQIHDPSLIPLDYSRVVKMKQLRRTRVSLLALYAKRVYKQIRDRDEPLDLYGWSMGLPVALGVVRHADKHRPGLVRNVVGINPGVFGGPPLYPFHFDPQYVARMWYQSNVSRGKSTAAAVKRITSELPDFSYTIPENIYAMLEAGSGIMKFPKKCDGARVRIYYSPEDRVIPAAITKHFCERVGITPIPIPGYSHDLPLLDTDGVVLKRIREDVS